jgi:hypothetical protein
MTTIKVPTYTTEFLGCETFILTVLQVMNDTGYRKKLGIQRFD